MESKADRPTRQTYQRLWLWLVLGVSAGLWGSAAWAEPAHYLVFETDGSTAQPVFHRRVELAETPQGLAADKRLAARALEDQGRPILWVELRTALDKSAYLDAVELSAVIRGEFHGSPDELGDAPIDGYRVERERLSFVLRLPVVDGATLRLSGFAEGEFDLAALEEKSAELPLAGAVGGAQQALQGVGNSGNRADFLIMGDGYTAAQRGKFLTDANRLENEFFSISPYREYRDYVKVSVLFTASPQSGADHPPFQSNCSSRTCCGDAAAQSDPLAGTFVTTAFNATYCTSNIFRLLTVSPSRVLAAASAMPNWDQILMLVNDTTYGGAGGQPAVASLHPASTQIMQHEVGHSFTGLADEYETPVPGVQRCTEIAGTCASNITDQTARGQIKWRPWIAPSTPVPTPDTPGFSDDVGLFEGGYYHSRAQYRPRADCLMRSLGAEFGEICAQEYVLRLLRGGFGQPAGGIDPIDPGSESPRPGSVNAGRDPLELSVRLLQPVGTPLGVRWTVDGAVVPEATGASLTFAPERAGIYTVELEVDAANGFVHPQMGGDDLKSSRRWTVRSDGVRPPLTADFEWQGSQAGAPITWTDRSSGEPTAWLWDFGDGATSTEQNPSHVFAEPGIYSVTLTVTNSGESAGTVRGVRAYATGPGDCIEGESSVCLRGARFKVEALWRDFAGGTGLGRVVPFGAADSGLFQFFGADNWELLVKVLNGCGLNGHYWLFAAATTNVEYALRVTDTESGSAREFLNPLGNSSPAITDVEALATCDPSGPPIADAVTLRATAPQQPSRRDVVEPGMPCAADGSRLCLVEERFEVRLDWRDHAGNTGSAQLTPARSDNSGVLWFFDPNNWEFLIKVLDGCGVNDHFWVFAAATTDVEYTVSIRDVETGELVEYFNPLGTASPAITDVTALAVCPL